MGVDLGINSFAALAYEDGHSELYPLNRLKQDDYYFSKRLACCDDSDSEQATRLNQKKSDRRTHYFHTLSKHIVERCVDEGVGTIVVGDLSGIREDEENNESKDWGKHGNLDLHSWVFDRFTSMLEYKAEIEGITVEQVSERDTSKSCSCCGRKRKANRVERGLYVCDDCETVANADVNGAENIRQKVLRVHRAFRWIEVTAGWHSHQRTCSIQRAAASHRENKSRRKPQYPNGSRESSPFSAGRMSLRYRLAIHPLRRPRRS